MVDLFFEVLHKKQHIFCDTKDSSRVSDILQIVEGILKIPQDRMHLVKFIDENNFDQYIPLEAGKALSEYGFTAQNAKAQSPASVGLFFDGEHGPSVAELSSPPPVPDSMRNETPQDN